jgi:hypothetical protein
MKLLLDNPSPGGGKLDLLREETLVFYLVFWVQQKPDPDAIQSLMIA